MEVGIQVVHRQIRLTIKKLNLHATKLLRNNKVRNYENALNIGATSVTSEKKTSPSIPVVELPRFLGDNKIKEGRSFTS